MTDLATGKMKNEENFCEKLDNIASEIRKLPQSELESLSKKIDKLSGEEKDKFERFFSDVLNDRKCYEAVGANYANPSAADILRLKVLTSKEIKYLH